jgi:CO dehydrogenase maturation factor
MLLIGVIPLPGDWTARRREITQDLNRTDPHNFQQVQVQYCSGRFGNDAPIAIIPDDQQVEAADLAATPVSQIPADSPARVAVMDLARKIIHLAYERGDKINQQLHHSAAE